ncbi:MAG: rod shape determining protein RodA [Gammaproteobacteria bacterium]|jgi:rod shape determining protein RodA
MDGSSTFLQRMHIDLPLTIGLVLLSALGLLSVYSAGGENVDLVTRQGIRLVIAFGVMVALAQVTPRQLFIWSPWLYIGSVILLICVLAFGYEGKGAQRWISIAGFNFQPSEIAKITVPMMVAYYVSDQTLPPPFRRVVMCLIFIALPVALIARQPDLGTSLLIGSSGLFVLFMAGIRWRFLVGGALAAAASAPVGWIFMLEYQRQRVTTFLNPEQDPLGTGYHIIQSKIAIGSGGVYGKGWLNGTQSQLNFLPERSTDFIFAVFSEEFGLLGVIGLLALYSFVVGRGMFLAWTAQELFGRLLAASIVLTFFVYIFVNVGMVSGLLPVVGVPLPLISYGGTSLVTLMAGFGIVMAMHSHRRMLSN